MNGLLGHVLVGAGKRLQSLIRMWVSLATQDGLNGFCHYRPGVVEVFLQLLFMKNELAKSLQSALNGNNAMTERYTDVTQYGTVGEVALQTAYRKLLCQELEYGIGYAQVASLFS